MLNLNERSVTFNEESYHEEAKNRTVYELKAMTGRFRGRDRQMIGVTVDFESGGKTTELMNGPLKYE